MQSNDARILRGAAVPTAVAGVLATATGAFLSGAEGAYSVALGVFIAAAFFALGLLALGYVNHRWPELFFGAAMVIYTSQMGVLFVVLILLRDAAFLHGRAFAAGVLVGTAVWLVGQVRAHMNLKILYVVPESSSSSSGGPM
jgi:ATP synthase protein I